MTHICDHHLTIIGSDNGLSPGRRQAIIWTNEGILLIWPLETNFSEILIEIRTFSLKKIRLKMSSAKFCPFRLGLNVLNRRTGLSYKLNIAMKVLHSHNTSNNACPTNFELTHWGRDKMDDISQTTLSNAFLWMKMLEFRLIFHWSLFLRV